MSQTLELYLHIPFCVQKCKYCDFVSFAGKEDFYEAYTKALCNEIRSYQGAYADAEITSLFIGGGTPSVLPVPMMEEIIKALHQTFQIKDTKGKKKGIRKPKIIRPKTEFSIECNPGTVDKKKLKAYKKMGINRISFGLQATDIEDLKVLGRIHTYDEFTEAFELAREVGFDNINVDLMQAIPAQTLHSWQKTLTMVAFWKPEHISTYSLIIEEGTPFYEYNQAGILLLPDEEEERRIYHETRAFLEQCGYWRYEISNFAKPGFECRQNVGYWQRADYLGLGLNASSMVDNVRWKNTADLQTYLEAFSNPRSTDELQSVIEEKQKLTHKEQMEEYMFLGLRMTNGVSKLAFFELFGQDYDFTYGAVTQELIAKGLLEEFDGRVMLTERGVDISNTVMAEFLFDK